MHTTSVMGLILVQKPSDIYFFDRISLQPHWTSAEMKKEETIEYFKQSFDSENIMVPLFECMQNYSHSHSSIDFRGKILVLKGMVHFILKGMMTF